MAQIADLCEGKEIIVTGMTQEVARCRAALERAAAGATVALISSGDPGVYGMAGLALEMEAAHHYGVTIEIIPGVSAANAAAARLGAPLMLDHACVSLSDIMVPWATIRERLEAVAAADLVVALYNPYSSKRQTQLGETVAILRAQRPSTTPVGIVRAASTDEESVILTDLARCLDHPVDMRTVVIVGSRSSRVLDGRWFVTLRGYQP